MGSQITVNDTLQITKEQGFPAELDIAQHLKTPFRTESFESMVFEFRDKEGIRIYQAPPVRVFLVENKEGKWIYWGLAHVTEVTYDQTTKTTSGKFKITYLYTPEEMQKAYGMIDRRPELNYFE